MPNDLSLSHDPLLVACSLLIAGFACHAALDASQRLRGVDRTLALRWWLGGSLAMGTGLWAANFTALMALTLPIPLGFGAVLTALSWAAAVAASAIALHAASHDRLAWPRLWTAALGVGAGLAAMHFVGVAALGMAPAIEWNWQVVIGTVVIAICASATSLEAFFLARSTRRGAGFRLASTAVMGGLVSAMHYAGIAPASFAVNSLSLNEEAVSGRNLGGLLVAGGVALVGASLLVGRLEARMRATTTGLNARLRKANERLRQRALRDPLTSLPNRALFDKLLSKSLQRLAASVADGREGAKVVVLYIDLDGFKPVNDALGHATGDIVLKEVARRLRASVRAGDTVARLGGDEFVMLMECETALVDPVIAARRIVEAIGQSIATPPRPIQISCSVGIATYPEHGPRERLVAHADAAMGEAKRAGGNTWAHFEERLEGPRPEMLGLQNVLRHAVVNGQLELLYQPKVDGRTGETHGVEALLRWLHPEHGMVSPAVFIPLAERFGLIGRLGDWVIDDACRQVEAWATQGVRMNVAINLSVHRLREADLVDRIEQALLRHDIDADQLLCEITESVAMGDVKATQTAISGLAHIGVLLSIDDFGTGYSSLSYLRRLPARQLKIDRSFVMDLETSADARAIVSAGVHLAHDLGLGVVAEGVETVGQRDVLTGLDCDELQGYLFARPMRAQDVLPWMAARGAEAAAETARISAAAHATTSG
ncbi:MAG: EAL domain-containing protein [Caulobacter sp.]|nr:EAL domain-containing protein [Vitreoscilla sp.]